MRVVFIENYKHFQVGNVCDVLESLANELIESKVAKEYNGIKTEILPEKETEKEVVYVPIVVNEEELMENYLAETNEELQDEIVNFEDKKDFKTKRK